MSRSLRIDFPGAVYHVMNRGAGFKHIFLSDDDRLYFLSLLKKAVTDYWLEIHAYCLMSNHYHLLIKTPEGNLSEAMRFIASNYARKFNKVHHSDGPLFRGRFKGIIVDTDAYFLAVSRYVHLNPVEAKMVSHPAEYRWSSFLAYLGQAIQPPWLETSLVLTMAGSRAAYNQYVAAGNDQLTAEFYGKERLKPIFGSDEFIETMQSIISSDKEIPQSTHRVRPLSQMNVIKGICTYYNIREEILYVPSYGQTHAPRSIAVYLCRKLTLSSLREIAAQFKFSHYASVSSTVRRLETRLNTDRLLADEVSKICKKIVES